MLYLRSPGIFCLKEDEEEFAEDATEEADSKQSQEGKVGKDDPSSDLSSPNSEPAKLGCLTAFFSSISDTNFRMSEDIFVINARIFCSPAEECSGRGGEGLIVLFDACTALPGVTLALGDDKGWQALKVPEVATMPIKLLVSSAW